MTAEIWNTYEMALAATTGGLIVGVPVVALMVLKRWDGSRELAAAKGWWAKAIAVQEANDKARWAPAYSGNLFAIEADRPHEGEVLHVEHPTGEIRLQGLADLAEEVALVQALSAESHEDEQAPNEDTDRAGMWRVLLGLASDLVDRAHDWLPNLLRQRAERDQFGSGEQATDVDPFAELLAHVEVKPLVLDAATEKELDVQRAEWVALNPQPYIGRHWTAGTEHTGIYPVINATIPAQRMGDEA